MKLLQTTKSGKGRASHYHLVYLNEAMGTGTSTLWKDHAHPVMFILPQPPMVDPMTGMPATEATPGRWEVEQSDGHTHELTDLIYEKKKSEKSDKELAKENRDLYRSAESRESDSRKKADASEKFYTGEQWKKADKDKLEANDRAALTINEIEAKIDLLSGYQRQNRSDFKFFPVEGGDGRVADILNIVVKNVVDQNDYEYGETDTFEDEAITGRGNIHCYIDRENDLRGEIKIEHFPWKEVYYGPHMKKDASDADYLIKAKWFSFGKVKQLWPEKAESIDKDWEQYGKEGQDSAINGDKYEDSENTTMESVSSFVNIAKKEYRILEFERKEYERVPVLTDVNNDFYLNLEGLKASDVRSLETIPDIEIIRKPEYKIRRIVQAGDVILESDLSDDEKDFSLIPVYAKKRGDSWWGKVEGVKDAQLEINKRHSQSVDILNKMAAYGWFYDDTTFTSPKDIEDFKAQSSKPGFNLKIGDTNRPPLKQEGAKFPVEIVNMMNLDSQKVKEIMNINMEMQGMARASQSGVAIVEQKRQGLIGNEFLFDNLNFSKKRLGKKIVRFIQKIYSPERILRIIDNQNKKQPVEIGGQPFLNYDPQEILGMLKNADIMKYDLAVSESSFNPTTRMANFLVWADLAGKGAQVPIDVLVDLSDLPDKDKVKAAIEKQQMQQQQSEKQKYDMEIQKTLIAKGVMPGQGMGGPAQAQP